MNKTFKQSMKVGYYFYNELCNDKRTDEWCGSEECATFTRIVVDYANKNGCAIYDAFHEIMDETINGIENETIPTEDHMWDDYCKGFLAGEILGMPTKENLAIVRDAERAWINNTDYGYYQEVLYEVK